ncbi:lactate utilization protein [Metallumcola ferriviriculae]|uniref:Lactate utilization protein n=1 Tax=Metallumcola ferriviriculae TaxID=3039180 RepID=A0AAU0UKF2_9FIRM|nr:lactate utilization protein [Desulfitibacteraceae bacterium MK1]
MGKKLVSQFMEKAKAVSAEVTRVKDCRQAYDTVVQIINEAKVTKVGCPAALSKGLGTVLKENGIVSVSQCSPQEAAELEIGITPGQVGIAETGTVAHDASELFSRYFSMLCSTNIVLLSAAQIKGTMDEAIKDLENDGVQPGYTAFITGPSRTADIERVLTIGVHGPERLCIILIDGGEC